jgi:adenylate cyclase
MPGQATNQPRLRDLYERIASAGSSPEDSIAVKAANRSLTLSALIAAVIVIPWPIFYLSIGQPVPALMPIIYISATVAGGIHFERTKRAGLFRLSQIIMFTTLPFLVHVSLGGFVNSSAAVMYSAAGAVQALSYLGIARARSWFGGFIGVIILAAALDPMLSKNAPEVPSWAITTFFAVNIIVGSAIAFLTLTIYVQSRDVLAGELEAERRRSDQLLLNVLPPSIAQRLKEGETPIADLHEDVAVLFADIAGFTETSADLDPDVLVNSLNTVFGTFDMMTSERGLEKIKTIGDAYLVVAGAPTEMADGLALIADLALAMRDAAQRLSMNGGGPIEMRFGIDAGPAVAGVIGTSKFTYDLYGDTVNTASRMESTGIANRIQVTERVRDRLDSGFTFVPRGAIEVKGKGMIKTFFLTGSKTDQLNSDS